MFMRKINPHKVQNSDVEVNFFQQLKANQLPHNSRHIQIDQTNIQHIA